MIENFSLALIPPFLAIGVLGYLLVEFIVDVIRGKYRSE